MVNNTYPRDQYPSRQAVCYPGRMGAENYSEDGRFAESPEIRGRPWTINRGLTELCGIPGRTFFVAAEENGRVICLSTPIGSSQLNHDVFFNNQAFVREVNRVQQVGNQALDESELSSNTGTSVGVPEVNRTGSRDQHHYQNSTVDSSANDASRRSKKRPRAGSRQRGTGNSRQDRMSMAIMRPKRGIKIGDSDAVYAFYDHHLRCCQQTACKTIAKAWVKSVAPRKQSHNPYTKGDKSRPDWWPKTYFNVGKEDTLIALRHKEPDHLGRDERVFLLLHILRMLVEPAHKQHPAIRKVELDLSTLEAVTFEALSSWFNDKDAPANGEKKALLKEIFKVAKQEARYLDNELDGNTEVFIMAISSDEAMGASESDDEESHEQILTPASSVEPNGPQTMIPEVQIRDHGETSQFAANGFPENVSMHASHFSHPGFESGLSERPNYVETPGISTHAPNYGHSHLGLAEMYPSPQESSRRSSVFNSPSDYESPATPAMYSTWSNSNTPSNASTYGFQSQPHNVPAFGHGPSYIASPIDGLPRPSTEPHHGDVFPPRGVSQGALHHQSGYQNYVNDAASLVGSNVKSEGHHPVR